MWKEIEPEKERRKKKQANSSSGAEFYTLATECPHVVWPLSPEKKEDM